MTSFTKTLFIKTPYFFFILWSSTLSFLLGASAPSPRTALTVAAVLTCPLQQVIKDYTGQTGLSLEELEECITRVTECILLGNEIALSGFLEEANIATQTVVPLRHTTALCDSFSQAVKEHTRIQALSSMHSLFQENATQTCEKSSHPVSYKVAAAHTIMSLLKKYTDGSSFLSCITGEPNGSSILKAGATHLIARHIPYSSVLRGLAGAWSNARQEISLQEKQDAYQDELVHSSLLTHIAHTIALEKVIKLFYVMYSPHSHPCDRMQALFLVNHLQLLGSVRRQFHSCVAHINHFYFSEKGALREYDPTRTASTEPRHIRRFIQFLKKVCISQEHYLRSLKEGASYGIAVLQDQYLVDREKSWKRKKDSRLVKYSHEIIKGILGRDLSLKKIDPLLVCSTKANKDLIQLIKLCEIDYTQETLEKSILSFSTARALVAQCKSAHHNHTCAAPYYLQRYYSDALGRLPLALRNALNKKPS